MPRHAAVPKPYNPAKLEESFTELMQHAAEFAACCGGIEPAKKALLDAGTFIDQAGSVNQASRALEILQSLREKVSTPTPPEKAPA